MVVVSRTERVLQNARVALFFYFLNLLLQFFSRKVFLDCLGAEILGLNTTAQNILQFLNLAESGIAAAVAFALYKPLRQSNRQEINEIISIQGWFYRRVACFVICGSFVMMASFPWVFAKANIPLFYAYGTFIAFLISSLLGYFANYKMVLLSADQKDYKVTICTQGVKVTKIVIQIAAVYSFTYGYIWWMIFEIVGAIFTSICLNRCIRNEYPWLRPNQQIDTNHRKHYDYVLIRVKQLFFHKVGGYVLTQTTPLIIYLFTSLTVVAIYGNYLLMMGGCVALIEAIFRGTYAGVGNLVVEKDTKLIEQTFYKLVTLKLFLSGVICSGILFLSESFISLWVGPNFTMPKDAMIIMTLIYFIQMSRTCDIFLSAFGLFKDIWAPIAESVLNICLSIIFGYFWGLSGILLGVFISQVLVVNSWKVYFLYKEGFKEASLTHYVIQYTKKIFFLFFVVLFTDIVLSRFHFEISSFVDWSIYALIVTSITFSLAMPLFYLFDETFRLLTHQLLLRLKTRIIK